MSKYSKTRISTMNDKGEIVQMNSATVYRKAQDGWGIPDFSNRLGISSSERILEVLRNNNVKEAEINRILRNSEKGGSAKHENVQPALEESKAEALHDVSVSNNADEPMNTNSKNAEIEKRKKELEEQITKFQQETEKAEDCIALIDAKNEEINQRMEAKRKRLLEIQKETKAIKNELELLVNTKKSKEKEKELLLTKVAELKEAHKNAQIELEAYLPVHVSLVGETFMPVKYAPEKSYVSAKGGALLDRAELLDEFNGRELRKLAILICGIENIVVSGLLFELDEETIPKKFWKPLEDEFREYL